MSAIVTNAKNRIAYNIVRSLGSKGIDVYTADFLPRSMSFASRYSKDYFIYPSPFKEQDEFINCLIKNIHLVKADVLIPVLEETFLIAKYKDELLKHVKMVIPDYKQILAAHNKDEWEPVAQKLNIPVPKTFLASFLQQNRLVVDELRFPVLIKPRQGGGGWAIKQIDSAKELIKLLDQKTHLDLSWSRFLIQEFIEGESHCVAMLFRSGKLRAKVVYKQLRDFPVKFGQATMRISIRSELAEEYFERLLEALEWHGVCQADFIIGKKTGIPYLIDVNPRFWGSLAQAMASGVDFPHMLYRIAVDGDVDSITNFKTGVMSRWVGGDLRAFPPLLIGKKNKLQFTKDFFSFSSWKVYKDDFNIKDPLPFFYWTAYALQKAFNKRSSKPLSDDALDGIWK